MLFGQGELRHWTAGSQGQSLSDIDHFSAWYEVGSMELDVSDSDRFEAWLVTGRRDPEDVRWIEVELAKNVILTITPTISQTAE